MVIYVKRINLMLLEEKSGSETVEVMKVKWPYCEKKLKLNSKLSSNVKGFELFNLKDFFQHFFWKKNFTAFQASLHNKTFLSKTC